MENTNTTQTDKKESLDLIDYRLTAIESTLAEMKNLLLTTKLQDARIDALEEKQKVDDDKLEKMESDISKIQTTPIKEKAGRFDSVVNLLFKIFITAVASFVCVRIGIK